MHMLEHSHGHEHCECPCPHHSILPWLVVLFALVFLLKALEVLSSDFVNIVWPILLGMAAFTKMGEKNCKCC